jgi:8-oxo-(d)GTP phosphatase
MQTILLIRHGTAKTREKWVEPDHLRPLNKAGHRQAEAIADELGELKIAQIRSSPAVRCMQTVEPLAKRAGMKLDVDSQLMEGSSFPLPESSMHGLHVYCAHGDNIPALLEALGIDCNQCKKGSIWMIKRDDQGEITEVSYVEPPEDS